MLFTAQEVDFSIILPVKMVFQPQRKRRQYIAKEEMLYFSSVPFFSFFFFYTRAVPNRKWKLPPLLTLGKASIPPSFICWKLLKRRIIQQHRSTFCKELVLKIRISNSCRRYLFFPICAHRWWNANDVIAT